MKYASQTGVSSERSRAEIEKILTRYGATGFCYGWQNQNAIIAFEMNERRIKFVLPLPDKNLPEFTRTPGRGSPRAPDAALFAWEQATRQRWRALALAIKAKLEAVECQIATFETEFMAQIVLPNKKTVGEVMMPQISAAYQSGKMPPLLGYDG